MAVVSDNVVGTHALPANKTVFPQRQCGEGMPGRNLPLGHCQVVPLSCGASVGKRTVLCMALFSALICMHRVSLFFNTFSVFVYLCSLMSCFSAGSVAEHEIHILFTYMIFIIS